ncbi:MAG: hypothetical protein KDA87_27470, partial [Planctomycetales bacterium]|nr:hypothetical protein [Planctomycetales bacterium]
QLFYSIGHIKESILAAVGELQFDVVQFRLETEYNAPSKIQWLPYKYARWYAPEHNESLKTPYSAKLVTDSFGDPAILLKSDWDLQVLQRDNPKVTFETIH